MTNMESINRKALRDLIATIRPNTEEWTVGNPSMKTVRVATGPLKRLQDSLSQRCRHEP